MRKAYEMAGKLGLETMEDDAAIGASDHVSSDSKSEDSSCCCPICLGPFLQLSYLDKCFRMPSNYSLLLCFLITISSLPSFAR